MQKLTDNSGINALIWMGIRTAHFDETVRFFRDVMALPIRHHSPNAVWFVLGNGTELHVYGPADDDHTFFGVGPVVGFEVTDLAAMHARMREAGIAFIGPIQESETATWNHFRGPDGNVYEIMSQHKPRHPAG